ncbi:MAG: protein of unknown function (DUF2892) [uncultured archaeon A07HB70]|nr:MAG: protein of unknown function (DUF2892) [uncultured archaeon A07HB70]
MKRGFESVVHAGAEDEERHKPGAFHHADVPAKNVGGRDRLTRALLAVLLTAVAVSTLGRGRRRTGLLALAGALGLGFNAVTCFCGLNEALGIDTSTESP